MLIACPYCGPRDLIEFSIRGEARARPAAPDDLDADAARAAYADALYLRDNPAGPHREHWFHAAGCQSWLVVERDTRTHRILGVAAAAARPAGAGS